MNMDTTRTISLWLGNEEGTYREIKRLAEEALESAVEFSLFAENARKNAIGELSSRICGMVREAQPEAEGMWADLMSDAISAADFDKIAEDWLEDYDIYSVSAVGEQELFLDEDSARDYLVDKLDDKLGDPCEADEALAERIGNMEPGDTVEIKGKLYKLEANRG